MSRERNNFLVEKFGLELNLHWKFLPDILALIDGHGMPTDLNRHMHLHTQSKFGHKLIIL